MSIEKVVNITVNTKGSQQAIAQTEKLNQKFKQLNATTGELKGGLKDSGNAILENGGAMGLLNDATGGLAMSVKDAVEATALFTKGTTIATTAQKVYTLVVGSTTGALKALRIALVATGLGAIVVAIGFLVSKLMEMSDATEEQTRQQELLNKALDATNALYKESIQSIQDVTKEEVLRAKIAGKSASDISKIESDAEKQRRENFTKERDRLLSIINDRKTNAENQEKANKQLSEITKEYFKFASDERIKDLEEELSVVDAKRQANKALLEKQAEDRAKAEEEAKKLREERQKELLEEADRFFKEANEAEKTRIEEANALKLEQVDILNKGITESEEDKNIRLSLIAEENANKQKIIDDAVANAKVEIADRTLSLIGEIAGKGSAIGKGVAIAQATISGIEGVQNAYTTAQKSPITVGFPAYPFIQAGLAGAFSLLQIKKIASTDPSGKTGGGSASTTSGGSGGATPSAPSFNLVAGSGSNQIAEGLASQRRPLQAYVVSGAVTSAQSLDRNIINDASI